MNKKIILILASALIPSLSISSVSAASYYGVSCSSENAPRNFFQYLRFIRTCSPADTNTDPEVGCEIESTPSDFFAFHQNSLWRTKIATNPEIDPNSNLMFETLIGALDTLNQPATLSVNYKGWTTPIHFIDSEQCNKFDISTSGSGLHESVDPDENGTAEDIPIPNGVWHDPERDGHMVLVDHQKRIAWEFSKFRKIREGEYSTSTLSEWDLNGNGHLEPFSGNNWWRAGSTGAGISLIGGVVTYAEFKQGRIEHALGIATPINRGVTSASSSAGRELCRPAARTDAPESNIGVQYFLEGSRLQLNPDLDLDSLGLTSDTKIIARALQEYGAYVWDNGPSFSIRAQNLNPDGQQWERSVDLNLEKIPLSEFRALACDIETRL